MKRINELDSLRGIAAFTVLLSHLFLIISIIPWYINLLPVHIFWAGSEAVILFFILSGFVLSLPFLGEKRIHYLPYITKRFLRIYLPYLIAICFTFYIFSMFPNEGNYQLSDWFNEKWRNDFNWLLMIQHLLLIGNFPTSEVNPVVWSLVHEMRISLFFPILIFFIKRYNWKFNLFIAFALSGLLALNHMFFFETTVGFKNSFFDTLHYTSMFIIGALLGKNKEYLCKLVISLNQYKKGLLLLIGLLLYVYSQGFHYVLPEQISSLCSDWGVTAGAVIIIILSLSSKSVATVLNSKPLILNGKISYSLYLYHTPVFLLNFILFYNKINLFVLVGLSFIIIYFVSYLSWRFLEIPSALLGKKVALKQNANKISFQETTKSKVG